MSAAGIETLSEAVRKFLNFVGPGVMLTKFPQRGELIAEPVTR